MPMPAIPINSVIIVAFGINLKLLDEDVTTFPQLLKYPICNYM